MGLRKYTHITRVASHYREIGVYNVSHNWAREDNRSKGEKILHCLNHHQKFSKISRKNKWQ